MSHATDSNDPQGPVVIACTAQPLQCPDCRYSLLGQPVESREDGLLVTCCPECGRVLGHPLGQLSRRDLQRSIALRRVGWWLALVAMLLAPGAISGAAASGLAWRLSASFAEFIVWTWYDEKRVAFEAGGEQGHMPNRARLASVEEEWLARQDIGALLEARGGWASLDWGAIASYMMWMLALTITAAGGLALVAPAVRRRGLLLLGLSSAVLVGGWMFYRLHTVTSGRRYLLDVEHAAYLACGMPVAIVALAATLVMYAVALTLMRPASLSLLRTLTRPDDLALSQTGRFSL